MKIAQPLDILYSLILSDGSLILARLIRSQIYTTFSTLLQLDEDNFLDFCGEGAKSFWFNVNVINYGNSTKTPLCQNRCWQVVLLV